MGDGPRLSVIVPVHQAAGYLAETLGALRTAAPPGVAWELLVVDDGSTDESAAIADRFADRVVRLAGAPKGPAGARNAGVAVARGEWLLFIDADVRARPDTLRRFWQSVENHPLAVAIFGTYDAAPADPGVVSRYRNLLHRYVHLTGAGPAETFWAGLGGVRADRFRLIGGFNAKRYPRPAIEDIEFGYRVRDSGGVILLDPEIQGTHLKAWTLGRMVVTDFRDRAVPWTRLLLERRGRRPPTLNISPNEQRRVLLAGAVWVAGAVAVFRSDPGFVWLALGLLAVLAGSNLAVYRWFAAEQGIRLAAAAVPLNLWYYLSNALAVFVAIPIYLGGVKRHD